MGVQGVQLDASSAGALHESLQALRQHEDQDLLEIMQLLVTKPMQVRLSVPSYSPWRHICTDTALTCRHCVAAQCYCILRHADRSRAAYMPVPGALS